MGIRALLTECILDGREELFKDGMKRLMEEAKRSERVMAGVGPHAPYTCSRETLNVARDLAQRESLPITIHLNETRFERMTIEQNHNTTPLRYIAESDIVGAGTILAHCVDLTKEDIEQIAASGASVAHNAQSNMKLASGIAPLAALHAAGANCTLATDGASSNNDLDMWEEIRTAALLQRLLPSLGGEAASLPAYEIMKMATVNGAKAIGMEGRLGAIAEGYIADLITVDISAPHMRPRLDIISSLVYCAKASDVRDVIVDGAVRVRDRKLLNIDVEELCSDVERRTAAILAM